MINFIWKHLTGSLFPLVCHIICTIVMLGRKNFTNLIFNEILVLISVEILYIALCLWIWNLLQNHSIQLLKHQGFTQQKLFAYARLLYSTYHTGTYSRPLLCLNNVFFDQLFIILRSLIIVSAWHGGILSNRPVYQAQHACMLVRALYMGDFIYMYRLKLFLTYLACTARIKRWITFVFR